MEGAVLLVGRLVFEAALLSTVILRPSAPSATYLLLFLLGYQGGADITSNRRCFLLLRTILAAVSASVALALRFGDSSLLGHWLVPADGDKWVADVVVLVVAVLVAGILGVGSRCKPAAAPAPADGTGANSVASKLLRGVRALCPPLCALLTTAVVVLQPCVLALPLLVCLIALVVTWAALPATFVAVCRCSALGASALQAFAAVWILAQYAWQLCLREDVSAKSRRPPRRTPTQMPSPARSLRARPPHRCASGSPRWRRAPPRGPNAHQRLL